MEFGTCGVASLAADERVCVLCLKISEGIVIFKTEARGGKNKFARLALGRLLRFSPELCIVE